MTARYAVYFVPQASSDLAEFGARWLGWDIYGASHASLRSIGGIAHEVHRDIVEAPSRYGFHATLKAPMKLAPDVTGQQFVDAVWSMVEHQPSIEGVGLALSRLGRFLALTLAQPNPLIGDIADRCVGELDRFRAPLSMADRERRRPETLTDRQRALLDRWGYPFVFEEYRFHMTLTGPLDGATGDQTMRALESELAPILEQPFSIDAVSVVVQDQSDAPFRVLERVPLRPRR